MSRPIGVLQVVNSFALGGAERMAIELTNALDPECYRCAILSTRRDGPIRAELRSRIPVLALQRSFRWDPRCFAAFRRFAREQNVRIIHSHSWGPLQYVAAALLPGRMGCKHIFHDHEARNDAKQPAPAIATRLAFHFGLDGLIVTDHLARDWARRWMNWRPERTFILRNGIATARFHDPEPARIRQEFCIPSSTVLIVKVANFRDQKDHHCAVRALAHCGVRDRIRLVFVGHMPEAPNQYMHSLRSIINKLRLERHIHFAGARQNVPGILTECDAGLFCSTRESGPLALLEYMAAGVPFAATRVGELAQSLLDGDVGFLVPSGDPEALAKALERLVELGTEGRRAMGARGRALVEQEYDQTQTARRLAEIYDRLLRW